MSTLVTGPVNSPYRRSITPSKAGISVDSRSRFEVLMDSVARLLANPGARLSSPRTINALTDLIDRAERIVKTADPRSSLIDVWWALLEVAETPDHNQSLAARRRLVVALAEMLCSPVEMPARHRQHYWEMLKVYVQVLGRTASHEDDLARIDVRFPRWMDVLQSAVRNGRIQPVTAPPENSGRSRHSSTTGGTDGGRYFAASTFQTTNDEAQYFGNTSDHWRRHTSHR